MQADVIDAPTRVLPDLSGLDNEAVNVLRVLNPFDTRQIAREVVPFKPNMTLADLYPLGSTEHVVSLNGRIVAVDDWRITYVAPGDAVVCCPIPAGGSAKKILGIVGMLAVATFAPVLGAQLGAAMGLGSFGTSLLTVGLTLAGSYIVHSMVAPSKPTEVAKETATSSPTYGIDGAKNTSVEGIPVPVCYGMFRMAGNIIGLHTENVGDTQDLYVLLNAGEGPVQGLSSFNLNDNPVTDYPNVEVQTRLGQNSQDVIPWFNDTIVPHNIGTKLAADGTWTPYVTQIEVDRIRVDLVASNGMYDTNNQTGEALEYAVPIEVQVSRDGTGAWTAVPRSDGGASEFRGKQRSAQRFSWDTGRLPVSGIYQVRVRRAIYEGGAQGPGQPTNDKIGDKVYISDINEIVMSPMTYPNSALVGIKVRLGEQLATMPQITYLNHGKVIGVWNGTQWLQSNSSNPAWIVWDMLTNSTYGAGLASSRLDLASFKRWADHCDAEGLSWNGPLDVESNVWDATQYVLRVGRAQLVNIGTRWSVVVEAAQTPSMMFTVGNMVTGSYRETWLPMGDRANEVDVTYFDKDDDYKRHTLKVYDPAALAAGAPQKTASVTLYGVVNYDRAFKEGMFMLNMNRYILKTVSFRAPSEALACTVGDLVYVQHDMPAWADAGRTAAGSTSSHIMLDRPVTMEAGKNYSLLVKHNSMQRASGVVTGIVGNIVSISAYAGGFKLDRFSQAPLDKGVLGYGPGYVELENTTGLVIGQRYVAYETEVIEERSVINIPGVREELELSGAFSQAPARFANWMFGETTKNKKVFRIKGLSSAMSDGTREVTAIQYDPLIYEYGRFGAQFSEGGGTIDLSKAPIGQVRFAEIYEETFISGNAVETRATIGWQTPLTGRYAGADVYVSVNGGASSKFIVNSRVTMWVPAARGQTVTARIVAFDIFGNRAPFAGSPEVSYTVIGELTGIDVGQVSAPDVVWNGRDCRLSWRYNSQTHSYEFGSEPDSVGADAGAMDPHFKDYEIRVFHSGGETPVRIEYTTQNTYVYSYEKNATDGLSRKLEFEIRMRDVFNNLGTPRRLKAENVPPQLKSLAINANFEAAQIFVEHTADADFAGTIIWVAEDPESIAGDIYDNAKMNPYVKYNGVDTVAYVTGLMPNMQYYLRAVAFDVFGFTDLLPSQVVGFKTTFLNIEAIAEGVLADSVLTQDLKDRINLIDGPADLDGSVRNLISHEEDARELGDEEVRTYVVDVVGAKLEETEAAIAEEQTTRAAADAALASRVDTVTTTLNGNTASVQTVAQSVDGLKVQYTVKIDNNGYVAGFGLASTPVNGIPTSEFIVRADRFAVVVPSGSAGASYDHPFTIGPVNGITRVIISSALIGDATINSAKIVDAAITNAKIGAQINSTNHIWNTQGWSIWKDGTADFNGTVYIDRAIIRRRPVIAAGTFDPVITISGMTNASYTSPETGESGTSTTPIPPGGSIFVPVSQMLDSGLVDLDSMNLTNNQPYRCAASVPHGSSTRNTVGMSSDCDFDCAVFAEVVPAAAFSARANWPHQDHLMIKFTVVVNLLSGSFSSFRFPPISWALYKI